jgi:hypothetical protein
MPLHILSDEDVQLVTVACVLSMEVYEIRCQKRYDFEKYFNRDLSGTNAEAYGTTNTIYSPESHAEFPHPGNASDVQSRIEKAPIYEIWRFKIRIRINLVSSWSVG